MRVSVALFCGLLAGCSSSAVTVPSDTVLMEVPQSGVPSSTGGDAFTSTIESAINQPAPGAASTYPPTTGGPAPGYAPATSGPLPGYAPVTGGPLPDQSAGATPSMGETPLALQGSADGTGTALDDDRINLMQWTLAQQRVDAAIAERELADARSKLVVVQPGPLPNHPNGVNIALFAQQSTNAVGERRYDRPAGARVSSLGTCGRFRDADAAQRAFLAGGGPDRDRYGIDPDGDGFACSWDPGPYRALR
jgi:hypothetical protein